MKMGELKNVISVSVILLMTIVFFTGCSKTEEKTSSEENSDKVSASNKGKKLTLSIPDSKLEWVGKKPAGQHNGTIDISSGNLFVDENKLTGGSFDIDFTSIKVLDITNPESNAKLTNHLKSDDFFSAEKFPIGKFEITSVTPLSGAGENNYTIGGNLTIKGITNPISFPAKVIVSNNSITASADFNIDRTQWDVKTRSGKFFENLGDRLISDEIELKLNIAAK